MCEEKTVPGMLRCDVTGHCWQVVYWPDQRSLRQEVILKRGAVTETVTLKEIADSYSVVC
jgi:hypothetical protein